MNLRTRLAQGTCAGGEHQDRVSEHEDLKPSIHDQGFPKFANHNRSLNICNGSIKDQCIDMEIVHVFVNDSSHSPWTKIIWKILEVYKNTNFEEIQSVFNITQKLILEHSEEILNVHTIESTSPHGGDRHGLMIKWSCGRRQKYYLSTQIPFYAWGKWMIATMQL